MNMNTKSPKWSHRLLVIAGVLVVIAGVSLLVSCEGLFGPDGGGDGDDGDSSEVDDDGDSSDVDPQGTWLVMLDTPVDGPTGAPFQAAVAEIDDTQVTIVFYGADTAQVAGLRGTYEVDGNTADCDMNTAWFPVDPQDPPDSDAPELKEEWTAIDWYEVVGDAMELSLTFDGTTFSPDDAEDEIVFEKLSFSQPSDLVGTWVDNEGNDLVLNAGGSFTYTYDSQTGGGPLWETSGSTNDYMRQVYDEVSDEDLAYMEYLSPYELNGDTLTVYQGYDLTGAWDYTRQ